MIRCMDKKISLACDTLYGHDGSPLQQAKQSEHIIKSKLRVLLNANRHKQNILMC